MQHRPSRVRKQPEWIPVPEFKRPRPALTPPVPVRDNARPNRNRGLRDGLLVARSDIKDFSGLRTGDALVPKGSFLALVWGEHRVCNPGDDYTYQLQPRSYVRPTGADGMVDVHAFPWAATNEPMEGEVANACFVTWTEAHEVVAHAPRNRDVFVVCLHAAADIPPHSEVRAYYGDSYEPIRKRKKYVAGMPPEEPPTKPLIRSINERPADQLGNATPLKAYAGSYDYKR